MFTYESDQPERRAGRPATTPEQADATAQRVLADGNPAALDAGAVMHLQRAAGNSGVASLLEQGEESPVNSVVGSGGGQPLDDDTRARMENSLGADFSSVRVHTGGEATESTKSVQAHAYTVGDDVVFEEGRYRPGTADGDRTLAHELTHVIQQRSGPVDGTEAPGGIKVSSPDDAFERAAEATAERVVSSDASPAAAGAATASVQRQAAGEEELPEEEKGGVQRQVDEELPEEEEKKATG